MRVTLFQHRSERAMFESISHVLFFYLFFFFSSRRRHTRSDRDWSSDVCSSDLMVSAYAFSGSWWMAMQTRATPGVYAIERSSRVLTAILPRTSIFPPRCIRNVRDRKSDV